MPPVLAKSVYDELAKAVKSPAIAEKLSAQGMDVLGAPPDQLDAFVRNEILRWSKIVKDNHIKSGD
jgi:tripartite-type tricarboxylate transporter receptor subunit TctC